MNRGPESRRPSAAVLVMVVLFLRSLDFGVLVAGMKSVDGISRLAACAVISLMRLGDRIMQGESRKSCEPISHITS